MHLAQCIKLPAIGERRRLSGSYEAVGRAINQYGSKYPIHVNCVGKCVSKRPCAWKCGLCSIM